MNRPSKRQRKEDPPSWLRNHSLACIASPWGGEPIKTPVASVANKDLFLDRLAKEIIGPMKWRSTSGTTKRKRGDPSPFQPATTTTATTTTNKTGKKKNCNKKYRNVSLQEIQDQAKVACHGGDSVWKKRIVIGTNQCTRALEMYIHSTNSHDDGTSSGQSSQSSCRRHKPSLIVLARDIYPPTMLCHIPIMAKQIRQQQRQQQQQQHHQQHQQQQQQQQQQEKPKSKNSGDKDDDNQGLPILLLPGKASCELGELFGTRRVSIVLFLEEGEEESTCRISSGDKTTTTSSSSEKAMVDHDEKKNYQHDIITSFIGFVKESLLP